MARTPTILIVDDEANIREVVRFALRKAGLRTVEAGDGRAALAVPVMLRGPSVPAGSCSVAV